MAKWADCVITRVRYNKERTHIEQVEVSSHGDQGLHSKRDETRATVVRNIKTQSYITAPPAKEKGMVNKGAPVRTVTVNNQVYLRTDANQTARDNLENLPEY